MVVRGVNLRTGEISLDFQELARQVSAGMADTFAEALGGRAAFYSKALRQLNLDGEIRDQLEQMRSRARVATIQAYQEDFGPSRVGPPSYRQDDRKRLSGHMLRALTSDNMFLNTGRTLAFGNERWLDEQAAHWRRLNFGAGAKGLATYRPRTFTVSRPGRAANLPQIQLGLQGRPSPGFLLPRGVFVGGLPTEGGGRLQRSSTGMFFPTDGRLGRSARQTAGIGASQFLDAGVEAIAEGAGVAINDIVRRVEQVLLQAPDQFSGRPIRLG